MVLKTVFSTPEPGDFEVPWHMQTAEVCYGIWPGEVSVGLVNSCSTPWVSGSPNQTSDEPHFLQLLCAVFSSSAHESGTQKLLAEGALVGDWSDAWCLASYP